MTKQKFAWKPKRVWNMKTKLYYFSWIWLCWYWDDGHDSDVKFFKLTDEDEDEVLMTQKRYTRMRSNLW